MNNMPAQFRCNGYRFRIRRGGGEWLLSYRRDDQWVSLSSWHTRGDAIEAAQCFVAI